MEKKIFDITVVGGGIIGLSSALAAAKKGLSVAVVERNSQCIGASIRNFGFVTISGQKRGQHWQRAIRSRDIWAEVAPKAGIDIIHSGLYMPVQRGEAFAVADAFLKTEMGEDCYWLNSQEINEKLPFISKDINEVFYSPKELRVESRTAIKQLARWLEKKYNITFFYNTDVNKINLPEIQTSRGKIYTDSVIICPGNDLNSLYPKTIAKAKPNQCSLQMLRVQPQKKIKLPGAIMSDLSLARYEGFSELPESKDLAKILNKQQKKYLDYGIHLIAVQSSDGSLVIGDSHIYDDVEAPFRNEEIDNLILDELKELVPNIDFNVTERWLGVYASSNETVFIDSPEPKVIIGIVTGGTGASTGFAFGEELVNKIIKD